MQQLLPDLWRFESGLSGLHHPTVSYVWRVEGHAVLIDPSADLTADRVPFDAPITDILVTHLQAEHAAGAGNFPDARLHVPAGDEYLCEGRDAYLRHILPWPAPWEWETRGDYQGHLAGAPNERPVDARGRTLLSLVPGLQVFGAEIVSTPGHGKHAVTFIAEVNGRSVAFCGDQVYGDGLLWNWFDADWDYGLEDGQRTLLGSVNGLASRHLDMLCPAHGPVIGDPASALGRLASRLQVILDRSDEPANSSPINFPDVESAPGFRKISPHLHQYRDGNCSVVISETGGALMIDDGLCYWHDLGERKAHHDTVVRGMKEALGISRVEVVIPTHYHGDHTENIPDLVKSDGADVICLDSIADAVAHGETMGLSCPLSWYGANYETVKIDKVVTNGTVIRWHEYELEIFHLGGQTFYHLGVDIVVDGMRTLFVGDAIHHQYPLPGSVLCYNDAEPETRGWFYSFSRMTERSPDLLVCGHGSAIMHPAEFLNNGVEVWTKHLERYRAISARPNLREFFDPFV